MTTNPPLKVGILGGANIARPFTRDVRPSSTVSVVAVASRTAETADAFAAANGIARHHGSYEALLADREVDAIYIPLPNSLHAAWAIKAAKAGKHVLCEKPLALTRAEATAIFDTARTHGVMLLEAYPYAFQPQTDDLLRIVAAPDFGRVRSIQASFGFTLPNPVGNIRMNPDLGGGALLDAGSYPLSLIRLVMGKAPERVIAEARWTDTGVDIALTGTLFYADGASAQMSCAMDAAFHRGATIIATGGVITTEFLNHTATAVGEDAYGFLPSQMRVRRGATNAIPFEEVRSAVGSGFRFEAEAFARMVATRDMAAFERMASVSLDTAATLEALAASARSGQAVEIA